MAEKDRKRIMPTKLGNDIKISTNLKKYKKAMKDGEYDKARKYLMKLGMKPS